MYQVANLREWSQRVVIDTFDDLDIACKFARLHERIAQLEDDEFQLYQVISYEMGRVKIWDHSENECEEIECEGEPFNEPDCDNFEGDDGNYY